jgi:hypothetical protein
VRNEAGQTTNSGHGGITKLSYFNCVAKPLLPMKTTGSISVERAAKPLKNKIADKTRNRNSKDKRTVLLRCGLNLRLKRQSLESVNANE